MTRSIESITSREEFIEKLNDALTEEQGLDERTRGYLGNEPVNFVVMSTRAIYDPANDNYDALHEHGRVDKFMAEEIATGVKRLGFIFEESKQSYFLRLFLVEVLKTTDPTIKRTYGLAKEYERRVQFSKSRMENFSSILDGILEPKEKEALCLMVGITDSKAYSFEECAEKMHIQKWEAERHYAIATAKLYGDKRALKKSGFSWAQRQELARKSEIARRRLKRLLMNGGYTDNGGYLDCLYI
ncbi:hypothetical protein IKF33_01605 [Candidatus Saccharibacteria bacterium]|nr:hypothetical protein [Candidatus Saccharibacteria bacterium]